MVTTRGGAKAASSKGFTLSEQLRLLWFAIDALTHLTIELGYVWLALTTTAAKSDSYMGYIWREYARADARWAVRDPTVISIEIATVALGFLCLLQLVAVYKRWGMAHPLQIVISVAELYGGWMTFAPQWLDGSPDLNGDDPVLVWVYLVFMNGLWVVIPALLLWESLAVTSHGAGALAPENTGVPSYPSPVMWLGAFALIAVYNVLVPGVLLAAEGVPIHA